MRDTGQLSAGEPVSVVAAVIRREDGAVLLAQRPAGGPHGGLWEFPGGKVEPGESLRSALVREIDEELGATIQVGAVLRTVEHRYPHIYIRMTAFSCTLWGGTPEPLHGQALIWVKPGTLHRFAMPAADLPIARDIDSENTNSTIQPAASS